MDSTTASFAFAHVDAGGIVTFRIARYLRLYGFGRYGGQRAEHLDNHEIWNYAGSGWATGVGIEVPLTPHGYGIDLGVQLPNGTFTDEERLKVIRGIRIPYRARMFYLGWGGPFTIDLFWR
jgi:hypothetical protein